jgi:hypothetical protein
MLIAAMSTQLLHEEVRSAVSQLGTLLRALILAAGSDPAKPQEVHRKFGIDRVLCWKISRIIKAPSAEEALRQLPGEESFSIFTSAAQRAGAPAADAKRTLEASQTLYKAIDTYVGDRPTLELLLDSVPKGSDGLLVSRKLAFRGNSGIWGVQARTRTQLMILAPNAKDPELIDTAVAAGWVDFRRLRLNAPWRLFRYRVTPQGEGQEAERIPMSDDSGGVLHEFCSNLPEFNPVHVGEFLEYEVGPSRPGSSGAFTIFSGFVRRGHGYHHAKQPHDEVEFGISILAPVENVVIDVLVHRSLNIMQDAQVRLFSAAFSDGPRNVPNQQLPIEAVREELGSPPLVAGTHAPRMPELADYMFKRYGWDPNEFVGIRFKVEYPPFPSVVWLTSELPERS